MIWLVLTFVLSLTLFTTGGAAADSSPVSIHNHDQLPSTTVPTRGSSHRSVDPAHSDLSTSEPEAHSGVHPSTPSVPPDGHFFIERPLAQPPRGWRAVGPMHPDSLIDLHLFLPSPSPRTVFSAAADISSPGSPAFGNIFSRLHVALLTAPNDRDMSRVLQWLVHDAGIHRDRLQPSDNSGIIRIRLSVKEVNELLHTEMTVFEDVSGRRIGRALWYSVPAIAEDSVSFIGPLLHFPEPNSDTSGGEAERNKDKNKGREFVRAGNSYGSGISGMSCDAMRLEDWRSLHGITSKAPASNSADVSLTVTEKQCDNTSADVVVAAFHGRVIAQDLNMWLRKYADANIVGLDGQSVCWRDLDAANNTNPSSTTRNDSIPVIDVAATAATQLLLGMGTHRIEIRSANDGRVLLANEPVPTNAADMLVHTDPVYTLLYSLWGQQEKPQLPLPRVLLLPWWIRENTLSARAQQRLTLEVAKLALMRVTVIVPSGDINPAACIDVSESGKIENPHVSHSSPSMKLPYHPRNYPLPGESSNDSFRENKDDSRSLSPGFPAACPFAAAVASLQGHTGIPSQLRAATASVGGFSRFSTPTPFMVAHAERFFAAAVGELPDDRVYNRDGSPFPAAASARGFDAVVGGAAVRVCGSTLAAAATSAVVAQVNAELAKRQGNPVGLLTHVAAAGGAVDVVEGRSGKGEGCFEAGNACSCGFPATVGWDAASGAGVVTTELLRRAVVRAERAGDVLTGRLDV